MGFFQDIKNIGYRARCDVVLKNLFRQTRIVYKDQVDILTEIEPTVRKDIFYKAKDVLPAVFDGSMKARPGELAVVLVGLIHYLNKFSDDEMKTLPFFESLLAPALFLYYHYLVNYKEDKSMTYLDREIVLASGETYDSLVKRWEAATGSEQAFVASKYELTLQYYGM